jgi:hypothetical protein
MSGTITTVANSNRKERILEIRSILKERDEARAAGNYGKADLLRDNLMKSFAIEIVDQKDGPSGFKFVNGSSTKLGKSAAVPPQPLSGKKRARDGEAKSSTTTTTAVATASSSGKKTGVISSLI